MEYKAFCHKKKSFYQEMYLLDLIIIYMYIIWTSNEAKAYTIWMN